jgi:hypothetical protein
MFKGFKIVDIKGEEIELEYISEFSGAFKVRADVLGQILPKKVNYIHTGWYLKMDRAKLDTIYELQFTPVCEKLHQSYQILNPFITLDHVGEIIIKLASTQTTCITIGKDCFFAECRIIPVARITAQPISPNFEKGEEPTENAPNIKNNKKSTK